MALSLRRDEGFGHMNWFGKMMSEEEYHKLEQLAPDRKYEYIEGKVYLMSGGSIEHDLIMHNVRSALARELRSCPCRVFGDSVQVFVGNKKNGKSHYVFPDTTVSCNALDWRRGNHLLDAARVVVEVLSPSTEFKDRGVKFKAYQRHATIQEIILVSQFFPLVEVWRRNEAHPDNPHAWLCRHYGPGEMVKLVSLNIQLAMSEIYQDIEFAEAVEEDRKEHEEA